MRSYDVSDFLRGLRSSGRSRPSILTFDRRFLMIEWHLGERCSADLMKADTKKFIEGLGALMTFVANLAGLFALLYSAKVATYVATFEGLMNEARQDDRLQAIFVFLRASQMVAPPHVGSSITCPATSKPFTPKRVR